MLYFLSLGSGSCGNSYYLSNGSYGILIDAGIGIRVLKKHFVEWGLELADIRYIFVTHDHADHVKSVGKLSYELNVPVYATAKVHEGIDNNFCVHRKIPRSNVVTMVKGSTLHLDEGLSVTSFHVPHDSNDNVGYNISWGGTTFTLMTDIGHVTDEMKRYIHEAEHLVIEANHDELMLLNGNYPPYLKERISSDGGHLSNTDCAEALAENASERLRDVWLCHLSQENNHPELARKTVEKALLQRPTINVTLQVLKRRTPCGTYSLN